ncbi:MAG: hypothetical protein JW727_05920 [Candidatus Aenigmarchaeota archaeon]|nr:hypothetical protein [Candidatus Aenigmarchaeota archaeon]
MAAELNSPLEGRMLNFLYRWHRLEKGKGSKTGLEIIDFDLITKGKDYPGKFRSRAEAQKELEGIIRGYSKLRGKNSFVLAKLTACQYYLRALQGEQIPFGEYVSSTIGVSPEMISKSDLDKQLKQTANAYRALGYDYSERGLEKFRKENCLSRAQIKRTFQDFQDETLPKVTHWLGIKIRPEYKVKFVDMDVYWQNRIFTDEKGKIHLHYNLNERLDWSRGSAENMAFHEICAHAIQALSWKNQVAKKKLSQVAGLTAVFDPSAFQWEGLAETLDLFCPFEPFSKYGLAHHCADHLYWLVYNNVCIMANREEDGGKIVDFVRSYLPGEPEETIVKEANERVSDPLSRAYTYVFGISLHHHRKIAQGLSPEGRKKYVLDMFQNAYTPKEILKKYCPLGSRI